ncbi:MAG: PE family protein [Mycobacterium sp.]
MSHVIATPHILAAAAGDLASVGSTIGAANATAAAGTSGVEAPGADSVSAFVTALFSAHAQAYQAVGTQAALYHSQFVQALRLSAGSYASAEAANASPLQKVPGMVSAASQSFAGHLIGNGANGAAGTAQHGGVGGPLPGSGAPGPSSGNLVGGAGDGHAAAIGGPQGGNTGGGAEGANGVPTGGGGAPAAATNGGGGGPDPGGAGGGFVGASGAGAAGAGVPTAWGPAVPTGPVVPGLAAAPGAPDVMAGAYPAAAGLAGLGAGGVSGDSAAIGGLGEPAAPAASPAAPAAGPAIPTAPKAQPVHPGNPVHPGDAAHRADADHDKPTLLLPLPRLRGLRRNPRSGLRDKDEWQQELREAASSKPWGRDELLNALGLRPPGHE